MNTPTGWKTGTAKIPTLNSWTRNEISRILQEEGKLLDIVKLGSDILPEEKTGEMAKVIRQKIPAAKCIPRTGYLCSIQKQPDDGFHIEIGTKVPDWCSGHTGFSYPKIRGLKS